MMLVAVAAFLSSVYFSNIAQTRAFLLPPVNLLVAKNAPCKLEDLIACGENELFKPLGLNFTCQTQQIVQQLSDYFTKGGAASLTTFCKALSAFDKCLGDEYDACIQPAIFQQLGCAVSDAVGLEMLAYELNYECSPEAYKVLFDNFDCVLRVHVQYQSVFQKCLSTFQKEVTDDPDHLCKYSNEYVDCTKAPFKKECGSDVERVICKTTQIGFQISIPQCTINCP